MIKNYVGILLGLACNNQPTTYVVRYVLAGLLLSWVAVMTAQAQNSDVVKKGQLSIEEVEVSDQLNGRQVVPAPEENEGIVVISVDDNRYFNINDVLSWFQSGRMRFIQINYEESNLRVKPDGTILIRYNFNFLTGVEKIARKVQISRLDAFNNYYTSHNFYKQQVVYYRMNVAEPPVFEEPLEVTGTLTINSNVEATEVNVITSDGASIDTRFIFDKPARFTLPVGTYQILASKNGYEDQRIAGVEISENSETIENLELQEIGAITESDSETPTVRFLTNVDRATITLVSNENGNQTSLMAINKVAQSQIEPGPYTMLATNGSEYREIEKQINIEAGQNLTEEIRMVKKGTPQYFKAETSPSGATVYLNGENKGRTPLTIRDIQRDIYDVRVEMENHRSYETRVDFATIDQYTLDKQLEESYIRVHSSPSGADVFINGRRVGTTPYNQSNPEWKEYTIRVEKELYEPVEQSVNLASVGHFGMNPRLKKKISTSVLSSSSDPVPVNMVLTGPDGYRKVLNKKPIANLDLPYGRYNLTIDRPGFVSTQQAFVVNQDDFRFQYNLKRKHKGVAILLSAVMPGVGQMYWGHGGRGTVLLITELAAVGATGYFYSEFQDARAYYEETGEGEQDMIDARDQVLTASGVVLGTYALNLIDRILTPSSRRIIKKANKKYSLPDTELSLNGTGVTFSVNF